MLKCCCWWLCDTETGALASWGGAEFGQLGLDMGGIVDGVQPRIVKGSRELHFSRVAAGAAHTLALTGTSVFLLAFVLHHLFLRYAECFLTDRERGCLLLRAGQFWCLGSWKLGQLHYSFTCGDPLGLRCRSGTLFKMKRHVCWQLFRPVTLDWFVMWTLCCWNLCLQSD